MRVYGLRVNLTTLFIGVSGASDNVLALFLSIFDLDPLNTKYNS
jgi:hypothetical protein